jgi:hypothetical protein
VNPKNSKIDAYGAKSVNPQKKSRLQNLNQQNSSRLPQIDQVQKAN